MKKTMFSLLMLAAMLMVASCGSKSNSGEATEEQANEVTFTDPAIEFERGIDLTNYISAESVIPPVRVIDDGHQKISFVVKIKLIKPIDKDNLEVINFYAKLCDENGSPLAEAYSWNDQITINQIRNAEVGKVFSVTLTTSTDYGDNMWENEMDEVIKKIRKITLRQEAF